MIALDPAIRNTVRAVIVREGRVLLLRKFGGGRSERFALPGGGQAADESLHEALQRECDEEIGSRVAIGELMHVAEFCKLRDTQPPTRRHLVEFLFRCQVPGDYRPRSGHHPDKHQVDVVWAGIDTIAETPLYPGYLADCLAQLADGGNPRYLGIFQDHAAG